MTPNPNPSPELLPETEDLRAWGYAPGSYIFKCQDCPDDLDIYDKMGRLGDKRSWRCEEHARVARDAMPALSRLRESPEASDLASDGKAFAIDAKIEYPAFASWWARTIPADPVPNSASHHFTVWMASARYRTALSPQTLPAPGEVPQGMKPWTGGDSAPDDWNNGPVALRNGSTMFPSNVSLAYHANGTNRWNHQRENRNPAWDIIAYSPTLATVAAANDEGVARASNDDPVGKLAIRLAATANEAEEEHGEWTWREIAAEAIRLLSQGEGK